MCLCVGSLSQMFGSENLQLAGPLAIWQSLLLCHYCLVDQLRSWAQCNCHLKLTGKYFNMINVLLGVMMSTTRFSFIMLIFFYSRCLLLILFVCRLHEQSFVSCLTNWALIAVLGRCGTTFSPPERNIICRQFFYSCGGGGAIRKIKV